MTACTRPLGHEDEHEGRDDEGYYLTWDYLGITNDSYGPFYDDHIE